MTEDKFHVHMAWLEERADRWQKKFQALRHVVWYKVRTLEDCVAANDLLLDVLLGMVFYPSAYEAMVKEYKVTTPERQDTVARVRRKLDLDGVLAMDEVTAYRKALEKAFAPHLAGSREQDVMQ
jgi:hypothetical protein